MCDNIKFNLLTMSESQEKKIIIEEPLLQLAQKCAWCKKYLLFGEETELYNGKNYQYKYWICHKKCNLQSKTPPSHQ